MRANPLLRVLLPTIALAAIAISPTWAGFPVPCPSCSTIPTSITLGGRTATGGADPLSTYSVVIRVNGGSTVAGAVVALDFSDCPSVELCPSQPDPGVQASQWCSQRWVAKVTDVNGAATFTLVGAGGGLPGGPCAAYGCGRVYADGVLMGNFTAHAPDLDGLGGVTPSDLALWLELFFSGSNCSLADYDDTGEVGPSDLSKWLAFYFDGSSVESCGNFLCP